MKHDQIKIRRGLSCRSTREVIARRFRVFFIQEHMHYKRARGEPSIQDLLLKMKRDNKQTSPQLLRKKASSWYIKDRVQQVQGRNTYITKAKTIYIREQLITKHT